ncbi:FecR family protein [Mucilaginibacter sp. X4EP1]|uniref:FecR family protein n=1 Tax=Mucilaginibacter sp. X4EP1 TaxID=2723092 RepID=UPI0021684F69|nr:FecR family protein [Mucilaginibacter sp. X4EP1]MCS3816036.1 ferric-dicitrate binding protein FerR (iron transport regulator) [Mucilaginibacter sp. X4EP1]
MAPIDRNELKQLAKKYLAGTATPQEKALLDQWYDAVHDGDQFEVVSAGETEADVKMRIFENLHSEIIRHQLKNNKITSREKGSVVRMLKWSAAAAAAIVFIFGGVVLYNNLAGKTESNKAELVNITTQKITRITLADGSTVWLNAHTIFKYPKNFNGKLREVELTEGRAFFDVKHEDNHPFVVRTRTLNITVLGTSFDVRAYAREGMTKVNVITGKVGVTRPGHANEPAVMLLPKQEIVLNKMANQFIKGTTPDPVINLWCKSPLVFDQENLNNVFKAIEKQYNTHIQVADKKLLDERISITLSNQRLDTIMEILSFTKHFNYQIANDSTVVIK